MQVCVPLFLLLDLLLPQIPIRGREFPIHPAFLFFLAAAPLCWFRCRARIKPVEWNGLNLSMLAFLGVLFVSIAMGAFYSGAELAAQSLVRWVLLAQSFALFFWMVYGPTDAVPDATMILKPLLIAGLLGGVFALLDFHYQFWPVGRFSAQYIYLTKLTLRRGQGLFYDSGALGNFCSMMLAMIVAIALSPAIRKSWGTMLLWTAEPVLFAAMVLSFSRGALTNFITVLAAVAWLRGRGLISWRAATVTAAGVLLPAALLLLIAPRETRGVALPRLQHTTTESLKQPNLVLSHRVETWQFLASEVARQPWKYVIGIGYKTLPYTHYFGARRTADNMYLSLLVETGVLGLGAMLALCGFVLQKSYAWSRAPDPTLSTLGLFLFPAWCGEMVQMLSGDILTYWRVVPVFFVVLGLAARRQSDT